MRAISSVERALLAPQLLDLGRRVRLGAEDDLAEQVEDRVQPGLRADEVAFLQAAHPLQRPSLPPGSRRSAARRCPRGSTCAASQTPARPSRPGTPWRAWESCAAPARCARRARHRGGWPARRPGWSGRSPRRRPGAGSSARAARCPRAAAATPGCWSAARRSLRSPWPADMRLIVGAGHDIPSALPAALQCACWRITACGPPRRRPSRGSRRNPRESGYPGPAATRGSGPGRARQAASRRTGG